VLVSANMRKGDANVGRSKQPEEKRWASIAAKCNPAIFELAQLWKESIEAINRLRPDSPERVRANIESTLDRRLQEIMRKYSGRVPPAPNTFAAQTIFSRGALTSKTDVQGIAEILHWNRHRIPLHQDMQKMEARDWEASCRVQRTQSDLERLRCGKGPIKGFKGDIEHATMFEALWGFGPERLAPTEHADFFDKYCPCGSDEHDVDALKKQRMRFKRAIQKAIASKN
jgi:hypothetical protein